MRRYCSWILRLTLVTVFLNLTSWVVFAQSTTFLALTSDTTELQTGQEYTVSMRLVDSPEIWIVSTSIEYDSDMIYVMGTLAGSPVRQGNLFNPPEDTAFVRNFIKNTESIEFTLSMLGSAQSPSGSGIVGTFRIYPLQAGTTTIRYTTAEITSIVRDENGDIETSEIEFTPTQLDLNITGESVDPPNEATATPSPTATISAFQGTNPDIEPTLLSVTLDPAILSDQTPEPIVDKQQDNNLILIALGLVVLGVVGIMTLGIFWMRQNR